MALKVLYSTRATAAGGRNAQASSDGGVLRGRLSLPKAMAGPGGAGATTSNAVRSDVPMSLRVTVD